MSRQSILLLHLLLVVLSLVEAGDDANEVGANYEQINAYLASLPQEQQEDVKVMMDRLDELLANEGGNGALRQILALKLVEKEPCQKETLELLKRNVQGTGGLARASSTRPIDRIVHHYLLFKAKRCQKVYPKKFKQLYHHRMEDKFLDQMDPFLWRIIERNLEKKYERDFEQLQPWQLVEGLKWISQVTEEDADVIYGELSKLAERDPKNGCLRARKSGDFDENCLVGLVNKYFSKSCEKYFADLGPEVYEQAIFDEQVLRQPRARDLSRFEYYLGWASYNICNSIRQNELAVAQLFVLGAES